MLNSIFRGLAYLYVAVALAPLVVLAIAIGVSLAGGGSFWPFLPNSVREIEDDGEPFKEEITFRTPPILVAGEQGSATALYALGVAHVSKPAKYPLPMSTGSIDTFYIVGVETEYVGATASQVGVFNNALLMKKDGAAPAKLFDRPVSLKLFAPIDTPNGRALILLATDKDTNKDGEVNYSDMHTVYVHLLDGVAPREVAGIPGNVVGIDTVSEPGALVVRTVLDSNGDGTAARGMTLPYSRYTEEPQRLYRIDLKTLSATPAVPQSTVDELQKALDGSKSPPATAK